MCLIFRTNSNCSEVLIDNLMDRIQVFLAVIPCHWGEWFQTFRKVVGPPSSGTRSPFIPGQLTWPWRWKHHIRRNLGSHSQNDAASHRRRFEFSLALKLRKIIVIQLVKTLLRVSGTREFISVHECATAPYPEPVESGTTGLYRIKKIYCLFICSFRTPWYLNSIMRGVNRRRCLLNSAVTAVNSTFAS